MAEKKKSSLKTSMKLQAPKTIFAQNTLSGSSNDEGFLPKEQANRVEIDFQKKMKKKVSICENPVESTVFLRKEKDNELANEVYSNGHSSHTLWKSENDFGKNVHPAIMENVISQNIYDYNKPFEFTADEIRETFDILDRNKQNYITETEVAFFLNVLDIPATQEEIIEMIRMVDSKEDNKIRFDDFLLMAKGYRMSPVGIAFPPTIQMLESKNLKKETLLKSQLDNLKENNRNKKPSESKQLNIQPKTISQPKTVESYDSKIISQFVPKSVEKTIEFKRNDRKEKLESFFRCENFNFKKIFEFFKAHNTVNINMVDFDTFFICAEFKDKVKAAAFFQKLVRLPAKDIDFQEILINWIGLQKWAIGNKAYMAFYVMDKDSNGILNIDNLVDLITWLHLEDHQGNRKKILQRIFEQMKISAKSLVDIKMFEEIVYGYENILFTQNIPKSEMNSEFN